jgi:hypothetical protein
VFYNNLFAELFGTEKPIFASKTQRKCNQAKEGGVNFVKKKIPKIVKTDRYGAAWLSW